MRVTAIVAGILLLTSHVLADDGSQAKKANAKNATSTVFLCANEQTEAIKTTVDSGDILLTLINQWPALNNKYGGNLWSCFRVTEKKNKVAGVMVAGENGKLTAVRSFYFDLSQPGCEQAIDAPFRAKYKDKSLITWPSVCLEKDKKSLLVGYFDQENKTYSSLSAIYILSHYAFE